MWTRRDRRMDAKENSITTDEAQTLSGAARLLGLCVTRDEHGLVLELRFRSQDRGEATTLRFTGVQQLKVRDDCPELTQIVYLESTDISSRGWESVRFQVRDSERSLSFYCA